MVNCKICSVETGPDVRYVFEGLDTLAYRLSTKCTVRVVFEGVVTGKVIDRLLALLSLNKDAYCFDSEGDTRSLKPKV